MKRTPTVKKRSSFGVEPFREESQLDDLPAMLSMAVFAWVLNVSDKTAKRIAVDLGILHQYGNTLFVAKADVRLIVRGQIATRGEAKAREELHSYVFPVEEGREVPAPTQALRVVPGGR